MERKPTVTVHSFTVGEAIEPCRFPIEVTCSSGTYIRSLAMTSAPRFGGGAHLTDLRRTAIGAFTVDDAVTIRRSVPSTCSPRRRMRHLRQITVEGDLVTAVGHGKQAPLDVLGATGLGPWAVLDAAGGPLAVYEPTATGTAKPSIVLAPATGA